MSTFWSTIIVGILSLAGTLGGAFLAHTKSIALITYRLAQLEKKVDEHNNVIERTYELEKSKELFEEKIKNINHRIDDLEDK